MKSERPFLSWLADDFERFIAVKRAGGAVYKTQHRLLICFDRYVCEHAPEPPLTLKILTQWLANCTSSPKSRDNSVSVVWQALAHARRRGAQVQPLPPRPPKAPSHWRQRPPRIVAPSEVPRLMEAARRLPPLGQWRGVCTHTLLGLLYVTGLRVGEARALNVGDLDRKQGILTIVSGKFGKSRALPLRRSVVQALTRYLEHPLRPLGTEDSAPFFVSCRRQRLCIHAMRYGIQEAGKLAQLADPMPRPHDFRHSFAVRQMTRAYAENLDFEILVPTLSTYLGHTCVEATRSYLITNGSIFEHAARRFAEATHTLDEVHP